MRFATVPFEAPRPLLTFFWHYTDALSVGVVGQASRAASRGTLDSSVPQVANPADFARKIITESVLMDQTERF